MSKLRLNRIPGRTTLKGKTLKEAFDKMVVQVQRDLHELSQRTHDQVSAAHRPPAMRPR